MKRKRVVKKGHRFKAIKQKLAKNSTHIMTGAGLISELATFYLIAKRAPIVRDELDILHEQLAKEDQEYTKAQIFWKEVKVATPIYLPAIGTGLASMSLITGSDIKAAKRLAGVATALQIRNNDIAEYKAKVKELVGETKAEKINAAVAKEAVDKTYEDYKEKETKEVIPDGTCLCYDKMSGRYFRSSSDEIRKAESKLNKQLISEMYVSLNDFYFELGLSPIGIGDDMGWNVDESIDIVFNSIVAPDGTPALVVEYLIQPRFDYTKLM